MEGKKHLPIYKNRSIMTFELGHETLTERVVLTSVTVSLTLILVMAVTTILMFQRRFATARHWLVTDWREPL